MFSSDYSLGAVVGKLIVYFGVANVFCVCVNACIQEIEKKTGGTPQMELRTIDSVVFS